MRQMISLSFVFLAIPLILLLSGAVRLGTDYRTANRSSAGIAPDPEKTPEAIVQVYAARALNWRGLFGVHTWIAIKRENSSYYTVHQVIGWRIYRNLPALTSEPGIPDRYWFGNEPEIIAELQGPEAERAIAEIEEAVKSYPYADEYRLWPGPNSNTFTAYVGRRVPELKLELPVTAIGKDFPVNGTFLDRTPSGTGYQLSIYGLLGVMAGWKEGLEVNLLGLSFGIDLVTPALKIPFVGRLGFPEARTNHHDNSVSP
jgi:Protein of unknown function (DUF3750)